MNSGKHQSAFSSKKRTVPAKNNQMIAHVTPRVRGYAIHKPQIEIPRLDMREIRRLQARARGDDSRNQQVRLLFYMWCDIMDLEFDTAQTFFK